METIDLEEAALDIARKHLLQNVSYRELGRTYYTAPSTVQRRLVKWLKEGRFELHDRFESVARARIESLDDELAEALVSRTGIWRARVARITGVEAACGFQYLEKPESEAAQAAYRASDELHLCLGEVASGLLLNSLRRNMTVGISSGRGVGFCIEKLADAVRRTPSWASGFENIRLVSLCGGAHVGMWEYTNTRDFDADENVFRMAALLKVARSNISYMTGPVSIEPGNRQADAPYRHSLDLAVFGLGQINSQHHYIRDYNELQLKAMSGAIRRIINWQMENPARIEGLAEIVLRLYAGEKAGPELLETIRETNSTILAVSPELIKNSSEQLLIAGGRQKMEALAGVLGGMYPTAPVDKKNLTLVTDAWTARAVLERSGS